MTEENSFFYFHDPSFHNEYPGLMFFRFPVTNVEFAIKLDFSVSEKIYTCAS